MATLTRLVHAPASAGTCRPVRYLWEPVPSAAQVPPEMVGAIAESRPRGDAGRKRMGLIRCHAATPFDGPGVVRGTGGCYN